MKKVSIAALSALLLLFSVVETQPLSDVNPDDEYPRALSLFSRGQRLMRERNFPSAIDSYRELVQGFKNSRYRDIYNYALARAYYHTGDISQALKILVNFHSLFPNSRLRPYAYYLEANCAYRTKQLEAAFLLYSSAFRNADDEQLRNLAERSLLSAVESGYFPADSILNKAPKKLECPLRSRMAYLMTGYRSNEEIRRFLESCPEYIRDKKQKKTAQISHIKIGALLPLSGPYAKYGRAILDGCMLASEILKNQHIGIEIIAYDTRADQVTAARAAQKLAEEKVNVIIGPLLSNVAATAAAIAAGFRIPLLVPAATQAGFTDLSPTCFQMSANMVTVGKGMAQYAVRHRGMTTLVVISPTSLDESTMADAFTAEAERLGAKILAVEKFRPGETDFGPYIKDIKESILGPLDDSTFYVTLDGDTLKPGEMAVAFDGLFMPATESQLFLLLPQLNFYRVDAAYLGTDEWYSDKVVNLGESVLKDAVFYTSKGAMRNSYGYETFAEEYDYKFGSEPDRLSALGYDAVKLMGDAYRQKRLGQGELMEYLLSLNNYQGASGQLSFGRKRTNLNLPLFKFDNGQIKPLFDLPPVEELSSDADPPDSLKVERIKYDW